MVTSSMTKAVTVLVNVRSSVTLGTPILWQWYASVCIEQPNSFAASLTVLVLLMLICKCGSTNNSEPNGKKVRVLVGCAACGARGSTIFFDSDGERGISGGSIIGA